ncbi:PLP-dependent aminotransferase family protein [Labrenzia sp. PHM005]|nr:PLP-dependent aminotransferase family protein [Labrenzia sp. PHM005]QDG76228.1 PLP-dependent aminotransferase family protein [Labrenzia sp. PHM005]
MTIWKSFPQPIQRPAYRSLADLIATAIKNGELNVGEKLPPHRELAYQLNISVQTVSRAYDLLIRRGMISGQVGRGTYVNSKPVETDAPYLSASLGESLVDFSNLKPVSGHIHLDKMRNALTDLSETLPPSAVFSFRPANALRPYQAAAASWLEQCGVVCSPDRVVLTNGSSSAMTTAFMSVIDGSAIVVTDGVCHHPLIRLSRYMDFDIQGLATDQEGIIPEALELACRNKEIKILFLLPNGLNPMAHVMGLERRRRLVSIAQAHDLLIIENDAWGPLQPRRLPPVAALAPERTFYFTSFTKCLMPGLRQGYLVAPEHLAPVAANRHLAIDWMATPLVAEIAAKWIEDGTADQLIDWQKSALARRNALAQDALSSVPFNSSPNGLHIWMPLPDGWSEEVFIEAARQRGVVVAPGSAFALPGIKVEPGIRICLGNTGEDQFIFGLEQLAAICQNPPGPYTDIF